MTSRGTLLEHVLHFIVRVGSWEAVGSIYSVTTKVKLKTKRKNALVGVLVRLFGTNQLEDMHTNDGRFEY